MGDSAKGEELQSILRFRNVAATAVDRLVEATDPRDGQAHWEQFLLNWRVAWEKATSYCRSMAHDDVVARHHSRRQSDPIANYAWEARNAETHDHRGSSQARYGVYIQHQVTMGGDAVFMGGQPVTVGFPGDVLVAVPVATRGGDLVEPPSGLEPAAIAMEALRVLDAYLAEAISG